MFRRPFHVRSLTKVKKGSIRILLKNKVVKPNYLLVLFSVFYEQAETKVIISSNYLLSLKFGEDMTLCCETWSYPFCWLTWSTAMWKEGTLMQERGLVSLHSNERNTLKSKYHSIKIYHNFTVFFLTYNFLAEEKVVLFTARRQWCLSFLLFVSNWR